jgi:hypothetical protein
VRDILEENRLLLMRLNKLEVEVRKRKAGKKAMQIEHREELRSRDRREFLFLIIVASCVAIYFVSALMNKGFL